MTGEVFGPSGFVLFHFAEVLEEMAEAFLHFLLIEDARFVTAPPVSPDEAFDPWPQHFERFLMPVPAADLVVGGVGGEKARQSSFTGCARRWR